MSTSGERCDQDASINTVSTVAAMKQANQEGISRSAMASSSSSLSVHTPSSPSASFTTTSSTTGDSSTSLGGERSVHFDERCVLIPERSNSGRSLAPRIATGTLEVNIPVGLPWRWPSSSPSLPNDGEFVGIDEKMRGSEDTGAPGTASPPRASEAPRVVLKVPYPIFRRKSQSAIQTPVVYRPSCLRHSPSEPRSATVSTFNRNTSPDARPPKRRSNSLPPLPLDANVETVPLRPCCKKCLAACEQSQFKSRRKRLPTLEESSREHTPSQSRLNLREDADHDYVDEEDWCAGLHFTKGAYKLWRSTSVDRAPRYLQEGLSSRHSSGSATGSGLLGSLVRVDEVDRKRGSSPNSSVSAFGCTLQKEKELPSLNMRALDRVRGSTLAPPNGNERGSPAGSENDSEEDLFPLPSPKRSPAASPSDSATCLPAQVSGVPAPLTEPRRLEAAIRAKIAKKERETQKAAARAKAIGMSASASVPSLGLGRTASRPIPIPGAELKAGVSHFHSNLDEIEWDPTAPDPDALPEDSTILLNSPPGSPDLGPSSPGIDRSAGVDIDAGAGRVPRFSASVPSLHSHMPEIPRPHIPPFSLSPLKLRQSSTLPPASVTVSVPAPTILDHAPPPSPRELRSPNHPYLHSTNIPIPPIPEQPTTNERRPTARRASFSNLVRASANLLRGLATSPTSTPSRAGATLPRGPGLIV